MLTILGAKHVEVPFIAAGQICTILYFSYFLFLVPGLSYLENTLTDLKES